jgi:parvulin-like peptidyl-prolyl isomerase
MITRYLRGFVVLATCVAFAAAALAVRAPAVTTPAPKPVKPKAVVKPTMPKPAATVPAPRPPRAAVKPAPVKPVAPKPVAPKPVAPKPVGVAVVDGRQITRAEMDHFAFTQSGKTVLRDMIDEILIKRAAAKAGIKVTRKEVDARIDELAGASGGREAVVAKRGVASIDALRQQIGAELLLGKLVEAEAVVTDKQARDYYGAHKREYVSPGRDHLFGIVTDKAETAYDARKRVSAGESFAKVAQEVSQDPSAEKGGDMGWVALEEMPNEVLRNVMATLKIGEVSTPLLVEGKFYILRVAEKEMPRTKAFDEAKAEVVERIRAERGATPQAVLAKLRRQAKVEVLAPQYKYMEAELAEMREVKVVVNGAPLVMKKPAVMEAGHLIVPAKEVFTTAGCQVQWVPASKTMVIRHGKKTVRIALGSDVGFADGAAVSMGVKAAMRKGTFYVAPRPVADALGLKIKWVPGEYTLEMMSK